MRRSILLPLLLASLASLASLVSLPARSAPPPGQSALLGGMHDMAAASWLKANVAGCDKGWITDLQYIGKDPQSPPGANCNSGASSDGISIIQRLDVGGPESFPKNTAEAAGFAQNFASFVSQCANIHVWIVGNEPNYTFNASDPDCSSAPYAASYVAVHAKVHALPGHGQDLVLVAPNSPYSPGCLQSLRMIIDAIKAKGVTPDGFAIHAYTQAATGSALNAGYVTSSATHPGDGTIDQCPGGATWLDHWHMQFRIYQDYIQVIEGKGLAGKPLFISESGNACSPTINNNDCYPDANVGYFQALYGEANAHNQNPATKTKIRAITPYRWTEAKDHTNRDFAIGKRPQLLADLKAAFAKQYAWTTPSCGGPGSCVDDGDCSDQTICDLPSGQCTATSPCGGGESCPAGQLCREPQGDCVPVHRGSAGLTVAPSSPTPQSAVVLDASHQDGLTNVHMRVDGPNGEVSVSGRPHEKINNVHHWKYDLTVGAAGTYRATFTADPGAATVYAITYFQVAAPVGPPADAGLPPADLQLADAPAADTASLGGDGLPPLAGGDPGSDLRGGCACAAGGNGSLPPWLLLALLALLRPRRPR